MSMKIRPEVIERINGRKDIKRQLAIALDADRFKMHRWIKSNSKNGKLTTVTALRIIGKGLNLKISEITEP